MCMGACESRLTSAARHCARSGMSALSHQILTRMRWYTMPRSNISANPHQSQVHLRAVEVLVAVDVEVVLEEVDELRPRAKLPVCGEKGAHLGSGMLQ